MIPASVSGADVLDELEPATRAAANTSPASCFSENEGVAGLSPVVGGRFSDGDRARRRCATRKRSRGCRGSSMALCPDYDARLLEIRIDLKRACCWMAHQGDRKLSVSVACVASFDGERHIDRIADVVLVLDFGLGGKGARSSRGPTRG